MKTLYFDTTDDLQSIYIQTKEALNEEGLVLLRGLAINQSQFEDLSHFLCQNFIQIVNRKESHMEKSDRFTHIAPQIEIALLGHSEAQYIPSLKPPDIGFLFCVTPPDTSGEETFLVDGIKMYNSLTDELKERFVKEKIVYEFVWDSSRWMRQYNINSEKDLRKILDNKIGVNYSLKNGYLHVMNTTFPIKKLKSGITFSNGILTHLPSIDHKNYLKHNIYTSDTNRVYWENGEPFSKEIINQLIDSHDLHKKLHVWKEYDLLIFDNFRYLHGRESVAKFSKRKILTRFGYKKD